MARWHSFLAGLLALAALASGCAANRPGNPFASKSSKSSAAQLAKKGKSGSAADGDESGSTGKNDLAANKGSKSSGTDDDDSNAEGGRGNATAKDGGHDPETMAYIKEQLRDATPKERQELLADLRGLHPEAVRQILQQRRRGINALHQQELAAQRNGNAVQLGPIQPASGESAPGLGRGYQTDASQNGPAASAGNGLPIGHNSAYRAAGQAQAPADTAYAALPPSPAGAGRVDHALGQSVGNSSNVNQALANDVTAGPRTAGAKPASVSIGMPMNAGTGSTAGGAAGDGSTRDQLARLISAVETEAIALQPDDTDAGKQAFVKKQVELRWLYFMSGQQERALQAIPGIDPADQEFWQQEFWGLTNYFDTGSIPSSTERAAQTVTQLTNAVLRLQEKASLELRNVTFCQKISNFGNFEKYPREEFSPGQEVLLYAEVANIHSEPIPDGKFRTSLKSTLEVCRHGPNSELIERIDLPETVDICRTHRRDYFHSYQFTIPTKLALGPHILKLTLEDQLSRRVATYTLNFTVK